MTEKSPGVSLISAFYVKAMGGFFFLFILLLADQKGAGAVCSTVKDGGLGGGALWVFSKHCR